jgi:TonB-linked SusC/RagA family outer membrane protein
MRKLRRLIAIVIAAALAPVTLLAQEAATVSGRVTNAQGQPEPAVLVRIESLNVGSSTGADGNYRLVVPGARIRAGQSVQLTATRAGLAMQSRSITLSPGAQLSQNFQMGTQTILLEDLVVTGVAGPTARANVPFAVSSVRAEDMPVASATAGGAIQGKVAGATVTSGTGRPGAAPTILLRGPTSINASGRSQEPLYIVDGVILSSSVVDIDALDIESIEVVKGAAGASLYGSRAASGVINIRTRRGTGIGNDQVRYTARTEMGQSNLAYQPDALFSSTHQYRVDGGQFVLANNTRCDIMVCPNTPVLAGQRRGTGTANAWNSFMIEQYPGPIYNQVDRFFQTGVFQQHYLSAEGRSGATNYHASYSNLVDEGVMPGNQGFNRHNFRINLDQSVRTNVTVSASALYSRSTQTAFPESQGNPMFALTRMPAGVDLFACQRDVTRSCIDRPDSLRLNTDVFSRESINPLYELYNRNYDVERGRFLGNTSLRYALASWLDLDANVSYDRLDYRETDFFPKGYRTLAGELRRAMPDSQNVSLPEEQGSMYRGQSLTEALNGSVTATANWAFRDLFTNRTQFRYLGESQDYTETTISGSRFSVADVPTFGNIQQDRLASGSARLPVRSDGYFAITNFIVRDRYILDALVRNDGSSLFGADERRQWYYRLAGAWRVSEEPWFPRQAIDNFRMHYSYGTAGGRPNFQAQYETFSVAGGVVTPITLGNNLLKPEYTREQETGIDIGILGGRLSATVTYADARTTDQILLVPLPGYTGYQNQWRNAGTLESNTWEAALDARLIDRGAFSWTARVLFDRTRQEITELNVPAFTYGVAGQNLGNVFYAREGEPLGTFYGTKIAQNCSDITLPSGVDCSQFAVNSDGFLVWVGTGGSLTDPRWGTAAPFTVGGRAPEWGAVIRGQCEDRITGELTNLCPLGKGLPDHKLSFSSNLNWGGFTLYGLLDSWSGFQVYNQPLQWAVFKGLGGIQDQTGVAQELQKPVGYYDWLYNVSGLGPSTAFVEDGDFVKLRELSARYRVGQGSLANMPVLSSLSGVTVSLTGRNLVTWTNYRGYDPEVGRGGGNTGSAALARVEGYQYPPFRTWTLGFELNF